MKIIKLMKHFTILCLYKEFEKQLRISSVHVHMKRRAHMKFYMCANAYWITSVHVHMKRHTYVKFYVCQRICPFAEIREIPCALNYYALMHR